MAEGAGFTGLLLSLPTDPAVFTLPSSSEEEEDDDDEEDEDEEELSLSLSLLLLPLLLLLLLLLSLSFFFSACFTLSSRFSVLRGLLVFSRLSPISGLDPSRLFSADGRRSLSLFLLLS